MGGYVNVPFSSSSCIERFVPIGIMNLGRKLQACFSRTDVKLRRRVDLSYDARYITTYLRYEVFGMAESLISS